VSSRIRTSQSGGAATANLGLAILAAGVRSPAIAVQSFAHFLARLEKWHALLIDRHMGAGARVAAGTRRAMLDGKCTKSAQFDPIAASQSRHDFIEDRVDDVLHIPLIEVRVVLGDALNQFGFDHRDLRPVKVRWCISVKMPWTVKTLNQIWAFRKGVTNALFGDCGSPVTGPELDQQRLFGGSIGSRGMPKGQHAIKTETIDGLHHSRLFHLPRDRTQAERIERNGRRSSQKSQVAEAR